MDKVVRVTFRDKFVKEFMVNTPFNKVADSFKQYFNYPILVAKVDNSIVSLTDVVTRKCDVEFYDRSSNLGNSVYSNSVNFMLILAVTRVLGEDADVKIEHSIDKGVYCEIKGASVDRTMLKEIEKEMKNICKEDLIFNKVSVDRMEAIAYFAKKKRADKVRALKYVSNTYIKLYRLDNMYDYFYGELAYSTGAIDEFQLTYIKDNGFALSFPNIYNPEFTLDYVHHKQVFDEFLDYTRWGEIIGISNAADLNEYVSTGKYNELIQLSEAYFNSQLSRAAYKISENRKNIKIVLIAGPSSSGKTTSSRRLEIYLRSLGLKPHPLSLDDYYLPRHKTPKDENGEYDYEALRAIDIELFNKHLTKLLDGEKVNLPEYNFVTGEREYNKKYLQIAENDIIIIEGLHGLNEDLTVSIDRKNKFKIYISPLTQLNIDNHNRIHTSDTRRLRRIVRDNKYRGYGAADTLRMWKKIRKGEETYIFPYQDEADMVLNSALVYEIGILKTYAEPLLFSVDEKDEVYPEALRLINFLRGFLPIPSDEVPKDSILREFIGGSSFN